MKIATAQTKPAKGDIPANIEGHKKMIGLALAEGADMIIFPELSITGYEPELAAALASDQEDPRLAVFQQISDQHSVTIGVGMPIKTTSMPQIGMIIFQPQLPRLTYAKQFLHADEDPYFVCGDQQLYLTGEGLQLAPAICYELSVPEHAANVAKQGAQVYLVSVAKTASGMEKAAQTLSETARQYGMTVLLCNSVGYSDNFYSAGGTAIWNNKGALLRQLDDTREGLLLFDTGTGEVIEKML